MKYDMHRKRPRSRTSKKRVMMYSAVVAIVAILVLRVFLRGSVLNGENRVRDLRRQNEIIMQEIVELEMEVTRLKVGSRIKRLAQEEIGLIVPEGAPASLY